MKTINKATSLRRLLSETGPVLVAGAHNGLSARLVERAGFAAVWASGFEISASFGLPDADALCMSECVQVVRSMCAATPLPIIADCDTGFGNAINVQRTVQEFERAGVAAICIEDSTFPKRCSFYPGFARALVSSDEFCGKIAAAKAAQADPDFMVIARTETLIAGGSLDEALRRAHLYADVGADMLLVHSKAKTAEQVVRFAERWRRDVPLVCVPTTYNEVRATELAAAGMRMVIYANHGIRAAIAATQGVLEALRRDLCAAEVEPNIAPLSAVYDLVDVTGLSAQERRYLPAAPPVAVDKFVA